MSNNQDTITKDYLRLLMAFYCISSPEKVEAALELFNDPQFVVSDFQIEEMLAGRFLLK